uniref:Uncharacterized protein n=1 Tax=Anguilla anguilla TaxID=7936 RepID=A0A0E9T720_ANGAN
MLLYVATLMINICKAAKH